MKQKYQIIISASVASFLAFTALAQETSSPKTYEPGYTRQSMTQARVDRMNDAVKASDIIGMTVNNYQGENIGKVEELAVDLESGRIVQVILSTGAFSGVDGMMTAVPPQALHHDADDKILQLDVTKEKLKMAPTFEPETWNEGTQPNRVAELYVYYGEHPYFISSQNNDWITNTDGTLTRTLLRNESLTNKADETDITRNVDQTPHTWSQMGDVQKASSLMGTRVNNLKNENLGTVDNLLVDLPTGRIVAVIISSTGFLGMGEELSPVPPTALRFNEEKYMLNRIIASPDTTVNLTRTFDQNRNQSANSSAASPNTGTSTRYHGNQEVLLLDASKKMLRNAPHFKADQWPDFGQASYVGGVYRAYNVEPYFNTNTIQEPDKISSAQ
jgi:sporulation protein YlmC with PRC-barrel domain